MGIVDDYLKYCTPRVRKLLTDAQEAVAASGGALVGPEHILLSIIQGQPSTAQQSLLEAGVTAEAVYRQIAALSPEAASQDKPSKPVFSEDVTQMLKYAYREAKAIHYSFIGLEQILLGMFFLRGGTIAKVFNALEIDKSEIRNSILRDLDESYLPLSQKTIDEVIASQENEDEEGEEAEKNGPASSDEQQNAPVPPSRHTTKREAQNIKRQKEQPQPKSFLSNYGKDLTEMAKTGSFDPVIGREREIRRITQILCRRIKNNAILLGEAGVGKTAIVEGLAMNIAEGRVPKVLLDKHVFALDVTLLVAGTQYRGQFEERMAKILHELKKNKKYILFLDEMHTIVGAGSGRDDGLDISNIMKPALSRGEIQCIGATTIKEFHNTIERNTALERRFQTVMVQQPSPDDTIKILKGLAPGYEKYHTVKYNDEVLKAAVSLSVRYLPARHLPDKAIDVIDEAGSMVRLRESARQENLGKEPEEVAITVDDIRSVVSSMAGVPLEKMKTEERRRMLEMESELSKSIIGQNEAVASLSNALKRSRAELGDPRRPIGSFLFVGPSGVGKSLLAKTLAEFMFEDKDALIRLDMSEYSESFNISKMIGSAPGYVGYEEGGQLTEMVRRKPYSVLLFDEIEKAHPQVINILLQILEDGQLTDNAGNTISFRNTIIIMTSNLGSEKGSGVHALGFGEHTEDYTQRKIKETTMDAVKRFFRPEVLSRIDEVVFFRQLNADDMRAIARLEISRLEERLKRINGQLQLSDDAFEAILDKAKSNEGGARLLRRAVEDIIENRLAEELLKGEHTTPFTAVVTKDSVTLKGESDQ